MELAVSLISLARLSPVNSKSPVTVLTDLMELAIFEIVLLNARASCEISLFPFTGRATVKSPSPSAMFPSLSETEIMGFITALFKKPTKKPAETITKIIRNKEVKSNEENQGGLVKMIIKIELDKDLKTNEVISINVVKSENEIIEGELFEVDEISKAEINEKAPTQE